MRIQELDPEKRYIVSIPGNVTSEDAQALKERLKGFCADALVVAGADIQPEQRYWGVWHEWVDSNGKESQNWYVDTTGRVYYYPSEAVAQGAADYFTNIGPIYAQGRFIAREFTGPKDVKK